MDQRRLVVEGLALHAEGAVLLEGVSLVAEPGRVLAVTGSSGSGKTTLLSVLGGLVPPSAGTVMYDGGPVGTRTGEPGPGTAFVLQSYGLVPSLTAEENVAIALRAGGVGPDEAHRRAVAALERVEVGDLADRLIQELSGGQLQRVAVARALAVEPDVLLADEPTSELDEKNRDLVVAQVRAEAERGALVVMATHDPEVAEACDHELHLVDGRPDQPLVPAAVADPGLESDTSGHAHDAFRRPE